MQARDLFSFPCPHEYMKLWKRYQFPLGKTRSPQPCFGCYVWASFDFVFFGKKGLHEGRAEGRLDVLCWMSMYVWEIGYCWGRVSFFFLRPA